MIANCPQLAGSRGKGDRSYAPSHSLRCSLAAAFPVPFRSHELISSTRLTELSENPPRISIGTRSSSFNTFSPCLPRAGDFYDLEEPSHPLCPSARKLSERRTRAQGWRHPSILPIQRSLHHGFRYPLSHVPRDSSFLQVRPEFLNVSRRFSPFTFVSRISLDPSSQHSVSFSFFYRAYAKVFREFESFRNAKKSENGMERSDARQRLNALRNSALDVFIAASMFSTPVCLTSTICNKWYSEHRVRAGR